MRDMLPEPNHYKANTLTSICKGWAGNGKIAARLDDMAHHLSALQNPLICVIRLAYLS